MRKIVLDQTFRDDILQVALIAKRETETETILNSLRMVVFINHPLYRVENVTDTANL